jgi:RNA polymerase sigma factor (sigma-70 family)
MSDDGSPADAAAPALSALLVEHRRDLVSYVERHAGRLLRHETAEDLVQGVHVRILQQRAAFEFRGRESFAAFARTVTRSHLADRHAYWAALRRRPARLVRLVRAGDATSDRSAAAEPAATATGPSTFASRREEIVVAVKALELLPERDRDLVRWTCDGVEPVEQARRLGISLDSADRARRRALERLRKVHAVITGG